MTAAVSQRQRAAIVLASVCVAVAGLAGAGPAAADSLQVAVTYTGGGNGTLWASATSTVAGSVSVNVTLSNEQAFWLCLYSNGIQVQSCTTVPSYFQSTYSYTWGLVPGGALTLRSQSMGVDPTGVSGYMTYPVPAPSPSSVVNRLECHAQVPATSNCWPGVFDGSWRGSDVLVVPAGWDLILQPLQKFNSSMGLTYESAPVPESWGNYAESPSVPDGLDPTRSGTFGCLGAEPNLDGPCGPDRVSRYGNRTGVSVTVGLFGHGDDGGLLGYVDYQLINPAPAPSPSPSPSTEFPAPSYVPGTGTGTGYPVWVETDSAWVREPLQPGPGWALCGAGLGSRNVNVAQAGMLTALQECRWDPNGINVGDGSGEYNIVGTMFGGDWATGAGTMEAVQLPGGAQVRGRVERSFQGMVRSLPIDPAAVLIRAAVTPEEVGRGHYAGGTVNAIISLYDSGGSLTRSFVAPAVVDLVNGANNVVTVDAVVRPGIDVRYLVSYTIDSNGPLIGSPIGDGTAVLNDEVTVLGVRVYMADAANAPGFGSPECGQTGSPSCVSGEPGIPGTGGPVGNCGPLSGDCTKGFLTPPAVESCPIPAGFSGSILGWDFTIHSPLDYLGYIWCEIRQIPPRVGGFIITAVNAIIDLLEPGQALPLMWTNFQTAIAERAPFGWFGQISVAVSSGLAGAAGSAINFCVDVPTTHGHATHACVPDMSAKVTPYRPAMVAMVYLMVAFAALRVVRGAVGGGGGAAAE